MTEKLLAIIFVFINSVITATGYGGIVLLMFLCSVSLHAGESKVLTNHLGYEPAGPKHAVILGKAGDGFSSCALKDYTSDQTVFTAPVQAIGPVKKWRDWYFWTVDFDSVGKKNLLLSATPLRRA